MRRTGLFGGTFNPPHVAHLRLAEKAIEGAGLDRVIIMPAFIPPHKAAPELLNSEERLELCRRTFCGEKFEISDLELRRKGKSYTVQTLEELKKLYPDDEFFLIIGSDMLLSFKKWFRYEDILKYASLCVMTREKAVSRKTLFEFCKNELKLSSKDFIILDSDAFELSSTEVRQKAKEGKNLSNMLTEKANEYIKEKSFYSDVSYEKIKDLLKERLDEHRYIHSLGVAESAKELAVRFGADENKAYLAGLLHDITKNETNERQLKLFESDGIILNQVEKNNPKLWHAMTAPVFIKNELGITDEEILSAVRYHTTGRASMSLLEKIVYIADYISAERDYPDVDVMRALAKESLEKAALYSLEYTLKKLSKSELVIHNDSLSFYNELVILGVSVKAETERKNANERT